MTHNTPVDETVTVDEQRARWEGENYGMPICANGYGNVENKNYNEPGHVYSVRVENSEATGCSCPHATRRGAHCKHQVAVENRPIILSSASALSKAQVATDGGHNIDDRFRLPEVPKHVSEDDVGVVDLSPCPACSKLTPDEFCSTECERRGETDETPL